MKIREPNKLLIKLLGLNPLNQVYRLNAQLKRMGMGDYYMS